MKNRNSGEIDNAAENSGDANKDTEQEESNTMEMTTPDCEYIDKDNDNVFVEADEKCNNGVNCGDELNTDMEEDKDTCKVEMEKSVNTVNTNGIGIENGGFNGLNDTENDTKIGRNETTVNGSKTAFFDKKNERHARISTNFIDSSPSKHSLASVDMEDVPTYLPKAQVRSRRRMEIGSENLITNDDLLLAATLVANAMEGQKFNVKREPRFIRSYNTYKSIYTRLPLYVAILVTLTLAVFEKPCIPYLELDYWITMSVEFACMLYFIFRICHRAHWKLFKTFREELKMIIAIMCIVITVIDMVAYIVVMNVTDYSAVRWSRILRPLLIINFSDGTHLKRAWSNIRMTLKQIAHVIALFYFLIIVFALVAMKMFQVRKDMKFPDGTAYFQTYLQSFWNLYVLVTTANNPDVLMPAYDKNRWYCLFFTVYIILCLYLMLNILLAVTYNSYRENMKDQIKYSALMKRKVLHQAFEVIKINVGGNEMVTYKTWMRLIKLAHPGKTKHQIDLLMMVLDTDRSGFISRTQFLNIADLLNVPISVVSERKTFMEIHFRTIYKSRGSKFIRQIVDTIYFSLTYDAIVVINVALICSNIDDADWFFVCMYVIEIALKWYVFGTKRYFHNFQHWTDVIITIISLLVLLVTRFDVTGMDSDALSVLNVFRIFRILRCLVEFERFRIIFDAVFNVSFSIFTYCGILFIVFYSFAILGMEIFSDKIHFLGYDTPNITHLSCNNSALINSTFAEYRYCKLNFNDVINSFVVLASLLIGNNWHVICDGFVSVTDDSAKIYFMSFHLCVAVVVMNIVTAFILDMFMYEYTFQKKGNIDTKVEMTIKNLQLGIDDETGMDIAKEERAKNGQDGDGSMFHTKSMFRRLTMKQRSDLKPNLSRYDGIRFHIKKRGWTKTELLLQQLFELEDDDVNDADHDYQKVRMLSLT